MESEAGTPKKGRKNKEEPGAGLTMGAHIEQYLQIQGKQVEIELDKIKISRLKSKGHIKRKDPKLLVNCIESLETSPPKRPYPSFSG